MNIDDCNSGAFAWWDWQTPAAEEGFYPTMMINNYDGENSDDDDDKEIKDKIWSFLDFNQ